MTEISQNKAITISPKNGPQIPSLVHLILSLQIGCLQPLILSNLIYYKVKNKNQTTWITSAVIIVLTNVGLPVLISPN